MTLETPDTLRRRLDESGQDRNGAPTDEDARNPDARPEPRHRNIAGHLEQEIADEQHACCKAERLAGQRQLDIHLQRGIADIGAIDV